MAKPATPTRSDASTEHFFELLKGFDTAVLVTLGEVERMHGRPMSVAGREDDGTLWFMTSIESPKVSEVLSDRHALVVMQSSSRFIVVEGLAAIVRDRAKIEELWSPAQRIWFEGKDDPDIALVRVSPVTAEYWDNAGLHGLRFAFEALKAMASGQPLTDRGSPKAHGKVEL
jgi:general stress protein 26